MQNRIQRADSDTSITAAGSYDARQINEALRGQRFFRALVVEKIDSTNTALFELGRAGEPEGLVLLAEEQSAGRGRMGRSWTSPKGKSILMSVLARARVSSEDAGLVNAAAGLAVVDAVRDVSSLDTKLKWPNDIVFEGKKLGGILTERGSDREGRPFFVIGIGLNVEWRPEDFPPDIAETATALSIVAGSPPQRRALAISIVRKLGYWLAELESGPRDLAASYRRAVSTIGLRVRVKLLQDELEGVAVDIDERGDLVVALDSGERKVIVAGDVREVRAA